MQHKTFVTVLGSSGCKYDYGNDTASFLINNKIIIDTGWNLVENLLDLNLNPADFDTVLFTHFHHDHYLALPHTSKQVHKIQRFTLVSAYCC